MPDLMVGIWGAVATIGMVIGAHAHMKLEQARKEADNGGSDA